MKHSNTSKVNRTRRIGLAAAAAAFFASAPALAQDSLPELTRANLALALSALGYDPVELGGDAFEVTAGIAPEECRLRVALGQDESLLWIYAYFGELDRPDALDAERLVQLLMANETYGPAYFSIASDGGQPKWVYLNHVMANRSLGPAELGLAIENLCATVADIIAGWRPPEAAAEP